MYRPNTLRNIIKNIYNFDDFTILFDNIKRVKDVKKLIDTPIFLFTNFNEYQDTSCDTTFKLKGNELIIPFSVNIKDIYTKNILTMCHMLILGEEIKIILRYDLDTLKKLNKFMAIKLDDSLELEMWYRGYLKYERSINNVI